MKLLMISGDRLLASGKRGAFYATLEALSMHCSRIDVLTPYVKHAVGGPLFGKVYVHSCPRGLWAQPSWIAHKGGELFALHGHDRMTVHEFPPFYNGIGARRLHRRTKIPYAVEIHHIVGHPVPASFAERVGYVLSRACLARDVRDAAAVRTVNAGVAAQLSAFGIPPEKISVVPSFYLDASLLRPDPHAEKAYDVVFCARLVRNKGLPAVLRAIARISDARLLVIGDGPERERAQRLTSRLGIAGRVTFAGWLPTQRDVMRALQSARIFVMNSLSEGGPRIALEAMACGMPVIATRVGVMPDVIRDRENGLFTTGDTEDLAGKIRMLLGDDEARTRMGMAAHDVLRTYERDTLIRQYADFLRALA